MLSSGSFPGNEPREMSDDEFGLIVGDDGTFVVLTKHPGQPLSDKHRAVLSAAVRASRDKSYAKDALDWWDLLVSSPRGQA